jgi:hypothetical protein
VSDLHNPRIGPHISCSRIGGWIVGIYKSLKHCGNWDCGCAIPFLGIFVSNVGYWFFAVCTVQELTNKKEQTFHHIQFFWHTVLPNFLTYFENFSKVLFSSVTSVVTWKSKVCRLGKTRRGNYGR